MISLLARRCPCVCVKTAFFCGFCFIGFHEAKQDLVARSKPFPPPLAPTWWRCGRQICRGRARNHGPMCSRSPLRLLKRRKSDSTSSKRCRAARTTHPSSSTGAASLGENTWTTRLVARKPLHACFLLCLVQALGERMVV